MTKKLDFLFFIGRPFGPLYGTIMKLRELCYLRNVYKQVRFNVPVISIGNLVLGGSGKTPTVIHIANMLQREGYSPCVVSRGYRGNSMAPYNIVSDGEKVLKDVQEVGDEPVMIAKALHGIPVLTGRKRRIPCEYAVSKLHVDVIILDDGFQHMGVARDVDIALFDSTNLAGNSRIFPAGPLREPVSALHRASAFLMTGKNSENGHRAQAFAELLGERFPNKKVYSAHYSSPVIKDPAGNIVERHALGAAYLFSGIENPERFIKTAAQYGIDVRGTKTFGDHMIYTQSVLTTLSEEAKRTGAAQLITTAKDFVKLEKFSASLPLFTLHIEQSPEKEFDEFILRSLKGRNTKG